VKQQLRRVGLFLLVLLAASFSLGQDSGASPQAAEPANPEPRCEGLTSSNGEAGLLPKACEFALNYRRRLPDFIAQQTITAHDLKSSTVLTEQVVFRQGREYYSPLTINGKPISDTKAALPPQFRFISAGEFGSLLVDLFLLPGATEFKLRKIGALERVPVLIYEFHIPKEKNSFWTIRDGAEWSFNPELRGELWLDQATGNPLREELDTVRLPGEWQIKSVKTITNYAVTSVRGLGDYLLPVESETTVCMGSRGASCRTNTLLFHDYQKFAASTRIVEATQEP